MGQPRKIGPRNTMVGLKASDEEVEVLRRAMLETGLTQADVIRTALRKTYPHLFDAVRAERTAP